MLISSLVTVFITTIALYFSFQASKALSYYVFDDVFVPAASFESHHFEPTTFELFEKVLNAFENVQSFDPVFEPVATKPNADNISGDAASSFSAPSSSSSTTDNPAASPTSSTSDSPSSTTDPAPTKSAPTTTGHSGSSVSIGAILFVTVFTSSFWFKLRPPPPPPPPPPDPQYLLWPNTWLGRFPSASTSSSTTIEPTCRRSNRLRYFAKSQPTFPEEELDWDEDLA